MWTVYESNRVRRVLKKLPVLIQKEYVVWKRVIENSGVLGVRAIKGYHLEKLSGDFKGSYSARLSNKYRVIFEIEKTEVKVFVIDITAHDYRRKK